MKLTGSHSVLAALVLQQLGVVRALPPVAGENGVNTERLAVHEGSQPDRRRDVPAVSLQFVERLVDDWPEIHRYAVEHRIALHSATATATCPSLRHKQVSAHVLRHYVNGWVM